MSTATRIIWAAAIVLFVCLCNAVAKAETEVEHPRVAPIMTVWGHSTLDSSMDVDTWKVIDVQEGATPIIQVWTGKGALCGCPHGDPFPPALAVYDKSGVLLGVVLAGPDDDSVQLWVTALSDTMYISLTSAYHTPMTHEYTINIY